MCGLLHTYLRGQSSTEHGRLRLSISEVLQELVVEGDRIVLAVRADLTILGGVGSCATIEHLLGHLCMDRTVTIATVAIGTVTMATDCDTTMNYLGICLHDWKSK